VGDIVSADTHGDYFVTERAKSLLEGMAGDVLQFIPLNIAA
jgi:hypothetical protein